MGQFFVILNIQTNTQIENENVSNTMHNYVHLKSILYHISTARYCSFISSFTFSQTLLYC
jgi:hypothetical protein